MIFCDLLLIIPGLVSVDGNSVSTLSDFTNLKSQLGKINPTGVNSASYTPTNTVGQECPAVGSSWAAKATPLPPSANPELCGCMMKSLSCVVKPGVSEDDYGTLFGQVCGYGDSICAGIAHNATTGTYGAYGMCNSTEQLAFAFNQYVAGQSNNPSACDFGGSATSQATASANSDCKALMSQAGSAGTGTVTSAPTGTAGSSGSSSSKSKGAANALYVPRFETGALQLGVFVLTAVLSGAGMILL